MSKNSVEPEVLMIDEVCSFLRVDEETLRQEIASGRLRVLKVGDAERVLRRDLERFLESSSIATPALSFTTSVRPSQPFTYKWPNGHVHQYDPAFGGEVRLQERVLQLQIGFRQRRTPGKERMKAYVFIDGYPRAEFVASDDYTTSGLMVSLVKTREARQVRPNEAVPPEYGAFRLEPYKSYVGMHPVFSGLAVVCHKDDFQTMTKLGIVRMQFAQERS
jgi:excisionase family DNA binding protein